MLSFNIQYQTKDDLTAAKARLSYTESNQLLIQVFCGIPEKNYISDLLQELREVFSGSPILGTTTAGEILDGESIDQTTVISFSQFDSATVTSALLYDDEDLTQGGRQLAKSLEQPEMKLAILFGCGIKDNGAVNGEPLLQGFQQAASGVVVVGGQAGDNGQAQRTFVFTEAGITDKGAAGASLSGNSLNIDNRYNLSWAPLGKKMTITKAEGTSINTIDNRPAKELYKHYLGDEVGARLPHSAAEYPLVVERNGVLLARHANRVQEDGSLDFMAPFYTGETVQFAFCHSGLVVEAAKKLYEELESQNHEAIFIYSCLSRKWVLGEDAKLEINPLANLAPTSGFFSYGEYFHNDNENMFLSQTMTILALSETDSQMKTAQPAPYDFTAGETKQVHDLQALHRLVETSAKEREDLIQELQVALNEIKTLRGFLPICASCKNIRDDKGYWSKIEDYISQHTDAQFSHGICPDCAEELYPEIYKKVKEQKEAKEGITKN